MINLIKEIDGKIHTKSFWIQYATLYRQEETLGGNDLKITSHDYWNHGTPEEEENEYFLDAVYYLKEALKEAKDDGYEYRLPTPLLEIDGVLVTEDKIGDPVNYIPTHANGNLNHPDTEVGIITSFTEKYIRFNGQSCPPKNLKWIEL